MPHRYVLKDAYWKMRIDHPYSMAAASDDLAATCGQAPIGESGEVLHPGDLMAQSRQVVATAQRIFSDLDIAAEDLAKVVIFTSVQEPEDLKSCVGQFRLAAPDGIPLYSVVIPPLFYDDLLLEVDFYAALPRPENDASPMLRSVVVELDFEVGSPRLFGHPGGCGPCRLDRCLVTTGLWIGERCEAVLLCARRGNCFLARTGSSSPDLVRGRAAGRQ